MGSRRLLVVDDDLPGSRLVKAIFSAEGFDVFSAHSGSEALTAVGTSAPDVILLDVGLPDLSGLEVLERVKASAPRLPVIMLTASTDVATAVRATRLGAFDYITKPLEQEKLVLSVRQALESSALRLEVDELRKRVNQDEADILITQMGPSAEVRQIVDQVRQVASSSFTVLILGETGTGKELVAQAVHRMSDRRRRSFVALDCGAIPDTLLESELFGAEKGAYTGADRKRPGRFQLADGGTCFLDEIGNLPMSLQAKLLRALESREIQAIGSDRPTPIDIRLVAATNEDLQVRAQDGRFRPDLYFRLAQYTIALPPLRARRDDIPYLTQRFLEEASVELRRPVQQLQPAALQLLQHYPWPGNVRELRNVVRQAVLRSGELTIRPADLKPVLASAPAHMAGPAPLAGRPLKAIAAEAVKHAERQAIGETLRATRGNKSQAARRLQTDYKTLHLKMKRLGLRARDFE